MTTILVSATEDDPTMPFEAWVAQQKLQLFAQTTAALDSMGVPADSPWRAEALRKVSDLVDAIAARDRARLEREAIAHGDLDTRLQ
jgi:hypothetical protein